MSQGNATASLAEILDHAIRCAERDDNTNKRYYLGIDTLRRLSRALAESRADAARYRWLKMQSSLVDQTRLLSTPWGNWDAAIDAFVAAQQQEGQDNG